MLLINYLAIITVLAFLVVILLCKNKKKSYLLFVVYSLPLIDIPVTPASLGSLKVFDAISYIIFFIAFKDLIVITRKNRIYFNLFCGLILILFIGSITSQFIYSSLVNILTIFPVFIYGLILSSECSKSIEFERKFINALKFIGIFSIIFLIVQIFIGLDFTFYPQLNPNTNDPNGFRYPGFFHDPQKYAQYLGMLSFLFLLNYRYVKKTTLLNIVSFIIIVCAILFTGGRSGLIGLSVGFLFLFLFLSIRFKITILTFLLIGSIAITYFSNVFITFNRNQDFSADYDFRYSIWEDAYNIYTRHPQGIGIGNYENYVRYQSLDQYFVNDDNEIVFFDQPENGYLKILVEYGIAGFIIFGLLILMPVLSAVKVYFRGGKNPRIFFFIAAMLSFLKIGRAHV